MNATAYPFNLTADQRNAELVKAAREESALSNALVAQKDEIRTLAAAGDLCGAARALRICAGVWNATHYGYKVRELAAQLNREAGIREDEMGFSRKEQIIRAELAAVRDICWELLKS
jgi:hypothetical protein